ncbi:hypothetical protein D6779_04565 [Candidatus Parcubacteria bacterium]|nr:MAG: hypothetical protein D6779_04565 [Candidatus Parcubacteria bacterium]
MDFTIYTLADPAFMEASLNGLAIFTAGGNFTAMVAVGMLIGVLLVYFKSIFKGAQNLGVGEIFVAMLIYLIAFQPTARVAIESIRTGEVRIVDNVPLGVAATGWIVSTVGKATLQTMQDAYDPIGKLGNFNYAEPLRVLNYARKGANDPEFWRNVDNYARSIGYPNADIRQSFTNYITDCTITKLKLGPGVTGGMTPNELVTQPLKDALKLDSNVFYTKLVLYGNSADDQTCSEGFDKIWTILESAVSQPYVAGSTSNPITYLTNVAKDIIRDPNTSGESISTKLSDVMNQLGWSLNDGHAFMIAHAIKPALIDGFTAEYTYSGDTTSAVMMNQALLQRNTQWAAEYSMFTQVMDPMIAFVEVFLYAITPILAFLMVMGSFGMNLITKFIMLAFWVWLWYPILSIVNLYLDTAIKSKAQYIGPTLDSFYASQELGFLTENWIGIAGLMGGATPLLALLVLTGSVYAMTTLTQRMAGKDHVDEKITTPDAAQSASVMQQQTMWQRNPFGITLGDGSYTPKVNLASVASTGYSTAHAHAETASETFNSLLGQSINNAVTSSDGVQRMTALGKLTDGFDQKSKAEVSNLASQIQSQFGIDSKYSDAVKGVVTATLSGSLSASRAAQVLNKLKGGEKSISTTGAGSASSAISASGQNSTGFSAEEATSKLKNIMDNASLSSDTSAGIRESLQHQMADNSNSSYIKTFGKENSEQLTDAAASAESWSKTENAMRQAQSSAGINQTISLQDMADTIAHSPAGSKALDDWYNKLSDDAKAQLKPMEATYRDRYGAQGNDIARLDYMLSRAAQGDKQALQAAGSILSVYGKGYEPGVVGESDLQSTVNNKVAEAQANEKQLDAPVDGSAKNAWLPGADADDAKRVEQYGTQKMEAVGENYRARAQQDVAQARENLVSDKPSTFNGESGISTMYGMKRLGQQAAHATQGLLSQDKGALERFGQKLASMSPDEKQQYLQRIKGIAYGNAKANIGALLDDLGVESPSLREALTNGGAAGVMAISGVYLYASEATNSAISKITSALTGDKQAAQETLLGHGIDTRNMDNDTRGAIFGYIGGDFINSAEGNYQKNEMEAENKLIEHYQKAGFTDNQAVYMAARWFGNEEMANHYAPLVEKEFGGKQVGPGGVEVDYGKAGREWLDYAAEHGWQAGAAAKPVIEFNAASENSRKASKR